MPLFPCIFSSFLLFLRLLWPMPLFAFTPHPAMPHPSFPPQEGYPPNMYSLEGGKLSPAYSSANEQAMHFINIIDNQQYEAAWLDSAGLLKDVVTQDQWAAGLHAVLLPLGRVRSRRVAGYQMSNSLPGGTRGDFMIIEYRTQFAGAPRALERVTLMREGLLGLWKVISYRVEGDPAH